MLLRINTGQIVLVENLVLPVRDGRNGEHEPGLIWVVHLDGVDARRDFEDIEVTDELFHQYFLARWPHTYAVNNLLLLHRKDLCPLDQKQLLLSDILAVFVGEELATSSEQLPQC